MWQIFSHTPGSRVMFLSARAYPASPGSVNDNALLESVTPLIIYFHNAASHKR